MKQTNSLSTWIYYQRDIKEQKLSTREQYVADKKTFLLNQAANVCFVAYTCEDGKRLCSVPVAYKC